MLTLGKRVSNQYPKIRPQETTEEQTEPNVKQEEGNNKEAETNENENKTEKSMKSKVGSLKR